ncbi:hypothetical protein, partial [Streptomyces sp. OspMP-M43]|uniref:hypothetical protein n=1 Tax=Streptomyces sp. OspMP-M43 TaxID=1839781 RepID=UPI00081AF1D1
MPVTRTSSGSRSTARPVADRVADGRLFRTAPTGGRGFRTVLVGGRLFRTALVGGLRPRTALPAQPESRRAEQPHAEQHEGGGHSHRARDQPRRGGGG